MQDFAFDPADLAPGDAKSAGFPIADFDVRRVHSTIDPLFQSTFDQLWAQFGPANEIETVDVLERRLAWSPLPDAAGLALRYDLLLIRNGEQFVATRDHTAVADGVSVVVHLSHALIAPEWRRTGLAGWLRAFPIQTARRCSEEAGWPLNIPITLVAEMEYPDGVDESREIRLKAYEKAGFRKVDPSAVAYHQPDFRPSNVIDASGGPVPLPFQLVLRRVGREAETEISGEEVRRIVSRLYHLYGREFRPRDMLAVTSQLDSYPPDHARIPLLPPSA